MWYFVYKTGETAADDFGQSAAVSCAGYGSYTFPAGDYEALRIVIGEGNGHNWWCVMYPNMCFSDSMYEVVDKEAGEKLREVLTTEEYEKVLAEGDYQVRMKYFSWLNPYLEKLAEN